MTQYLKWRISTTEAGLARGNFFIWELPPPSLPDYQNFSERVPEAEGGEATVGYAKLELTWENVSPHVLRTLRRLVQTSLDGTKDLYLTIDRSNGEGSGYDWVDVKGIPHIPEKRVGRNSSGSRGTFLSSVLLRVNNITIVNDPATNA